MATKMQLVSMLGQALLDEADQLNSVVSALNVTREEQKTVERRIALLKELLVLYTGSEREISELSNLIDDHS